MKDIFSKSNDFKSEYCISIVQINTIEPIENSDFLARTVVNGEPIVIRKDQVHPGDILFYASNECALNKDFLRVNNLFEWSLRELNDNYKEVQKTLEESGEENAKRMVGFFNKHGRVRAIKLRGTLSMGYLFSLNELSKYNPKVSSIELEKHLREDFDTVCGELFVKAYIPDIKVPNKHNNMKRQNKITKKFDRLIKNEFFLHYDTAPLAKDFDKLFSPDSQVVITRKVHGTSSVLGNVRVKNPLKISLHKRLLNWFIKITGLLSKYYTVDYEIVYDNIYSSRKVIKNQYINKKVTPGFYDVDIWSEYNELLKGKIPQGMTVYGEIVGYLSNSKKYIQEGYDYGCMEGTNKLMPYRITTTNEDGTKHEFEVCEVLEWTKELVNTYPELSSRIMFIDILYQGSLKDIYPEISQAVHWHENFLDVLRNDKKKFGFELNERLCKNKVPFEGIVIRKLSDPTPEAYKLKSQRFMDKERRLIDAGIVDMEMSQDL